jgi:hypothetical protein
VDIDFVAIAPRRGQDVRYSAVYVVIEGAGYCAPEVSKHESAPSHAWRRCKSSP